MRNEIHLSEIVIQNRIRPADPVKVASLAASIAEIGQQQPVGLGEGNRLVFGFHRYMAIKKLGQDTIWAEPVPAEGLKKAEQKDLEELAEIDENLCRNELSELLIGQLISRREKILERRGMRAKSGDNQRRRGETIAGARTTKDLAAEVGMSERSYQQKKQIGDKILPEVAEAISHTAAADSTTQLLQLAKLSEDGQKRAKNLIVAGDAKDLRDALRQIRRSDLGSAPLPDDVFNLITSDFPWHFDNDGARGSAENHYPTMTLEQMLAMDFGRVHARNVVHFLWLTKHHHEEALALLKSWGLTYNSEIIWKKPSIGNGSWVRGKHEKIWILSRGENMTPAWQPESVVEWPNPPEHSRKPPEFFEMVNRMYPHLRKRLELFGRSPREGYVVHGNESEKFPDQTQPVLLAGSVE